jgi:hypothetical protein
VVHDRASINESCVVVRLIVLFHCIIVSRFERLSIFHCQCPVSTRKALWPILNRMCQPPFELAIYSELPHFIRSRTFFRPPPPAGVHTAAQTNAVLQVDKPATHRVSKQASNCLIFIYVGVYVCFLSPEANYVQMPRLLGMQKP